jgi:hypothetical protein
MKGAIQTQTRIDIPGEFTWRCDNSFQCGADIGIAMRLTAGESARITTKKGKVGMQLLAKRHSPVFLLARKTGGLNIPSRPGRDDRFAPYIASQHGDVAFDQPTLRHDCAGSARATRAERKKRFCMEPSKARIVSQPFGFFAGSIMLTGRLLERMY